jgi:hypothetical protein
MKKALETPISSTKAHAAAYGAAVKHPLAPPMTLGNMPHSRYAYSFRYVSLNPMKDRQMSWTAARRLLLDGPARWGAGTRCGRSTVRWSRSGNAVGCDVLRSGPCSWDGETQERSIRPKFCIL